MQTEYVEIARNSLFIPTECLGTFWSTTVKEMFLITEVPCVGFYMCKKKKQTTEKAALTLPLLIPLMGVYKFLFISCVIVSR